MRRVNKRNVDSSGVITIEACIFGISFLIILLALSGFFVVYMAQSKIADTALKATQSLANETYSINKLHLSKINTWEGGYGESGSVQSSLGWIVSEAFSIFNKPNNPDNFTYSQSMTSENLWWTQGKVGDVAKKRFIGYLSGGDVKKADGILQGMRVINGINGLDFSDSYVDDEVLHVVIKYKVEIPFNIFKLGKKTTTEKVCAQLWLEGV